MPDSLGDAAQTRAIVDQAAKASAMLAVTEFVASHPELIAKPKPEIPAPLKWAGGIAAALLTTGVGGTAVWAMTTINEMQVTVARIDERMVSSQQSQDSRFEEINRRLSRLEQQMAGDDK
jgi:hypothetical protein